MVLLEIISASVATPSKKKETATGPSPFYYNYR